MELTRSIRLRRLQWVGHVMRMKDERVPKKVLKRYTEARRPAGPRGRWLDAVDRDGTRMLKGRKWRRPARMEMPGGRGVKRPRPKLGCSAIQQQQQGGREEEEEKFKS
jgi:hypothetical protein